MKDFHEGRLVVKLPTFVLWSCPWFSTWFTSGLNYWIVTEKISCLSVHATCLACCSFLSLTYPYIHLLLYPRYGCVCIAMELHRRGT